MLTARAREGLDAKVPEGVVDLMRTRRLEPEAHFAERRILPDADGVLGLDQRRAIGGRGQIFVLDMGEPVKILDLACNMIRLSGKEPRLHSDGEPGPNDIAVKFVGARPGEKLHEELWGDSESVGATDHPKIMRLSRAPIDAAWLSQQLVELEQLADDGDTLEVVAKLGAIVRDCQRAAPLQYWHEKHREL